VRCSRRHRVDGLARVSTRDRGLQRQIIAQLVVVVEVLITQRQRIDTLPQQLQQGMFAAGLSATIPHDLGRCLGQPQLPIDLCKQRYTAVAGDVAATEIGFDSTALGGWKFEASLVAFCGG